MQVFNHLRHPFSITKEDKSIVSLKPEQIRNSKIMVITIAIFSAVGSFFARIALPQALTASLTLGALTFYVITGYYKSQDNGANKLPPKNPPPSIPFAPLPKQEDKAAPQPVTTKPLPSTPPAVNPRPEVPKIATPPSIPSQPAYLNEQKPIYKEHQNWAGQSSISMGDEMRMGTNFGTDHMMEMFKMSLQSGCEGRIHYVVYHHLHHLKMGMIPPEYEMNYIDSLGFFVISAFEELPEIQECLKNNKKLSSDLKETLKTLKFVLAKHVNLDPKTITDQMVLDSSDKFEEIKKKKVSYLKTKFIPELLRILEKREATPDTGHLSSIPMVMSSDGITRWKEAVEQNKSFILFQRLEHLHPYMEPNQLEQLNNIFDNPKKPSSPSTDDDLVD